MSENIRRTLSMLKNGEIGVEKAEELLKLQYASIAEPKRVWITVRESGRKKTDMKLPLPLVLLGLKMGRGLGLGDSDLAESELGAVALDILRKLDSETLIAEIKSGGISLPCLLAEIENTEKGESIKVVLE